MLYWLIPLIIFAASLVGLIFLLVIKIPALARLPELTQTETFEQKRKEQLMKIRFQRIWREKMSRRFSFTRTFILRIKQLFYVVYYKVQAIEAKYQKQGAAPVEGLKEKVQKLVWEAGELVNQDQFDQAEKKYIQVITWDRRNIGAYKGLADLYWRKKDYQQAKETLEHTLKINRQDPDTLWKLGSLLTEMGQKELSFVYFNKAYEIAQNNPKYVDSLLEISIILGKKDLAWKLVSKFKEINPENQKLNDFEERIRKL